MASKRPHRRKGPNYSGVYGLYAVKVRHCMLFERQQYTHLFVPTSKVRYARTRTVRYSRTAPTFGLSRICSSNKSIRGLNRPLVTGVIKESDWPCPSCFVFLVSCLLGQLGPPEPGGIRGRRLVGEARSFWQTAAS